MSTTPNTVDISTMTDEQLAVFMAEARRRKMIKVKSEKFAKFEPVYSQYRTAVTEAKKSNDLKKSLLAQLKTLGFGAKVSKTNGTTPATGATYIAPESTSTKKTTGKKK